jgi:hypothetical protein
MFRLFCLFFFSFWESFYHVFLVRGGDALDDIFCFSICSFAMIGALARRFSACVHAEIHARRARVLGSIRDRRGVTICPVSENNRSTATDVAGTSNIERAML